VVDAVPFEEEDESPFVGLLRVERGPSRHAGGVRGRASAQAASVSGSSSIAVEEGEKGFGRRGSRTKESGGGSLMKKSPQRPNVRSSRRKRNRRWSQWSRHCRFASSSFVGLLKVETV
jgi:hypothetical protein